MIEKFEEAKQEVEELAVDLTEAVRTVTQGYTANLDNIVAELSKGINLYSNSELWDFQMRLSIEAYVLGNLKEQSALKDACAEALYKQSIASEFSNATGSQEVKKQASIMNTADKQAVAILYNTVSNLLKTKCDEAHRLVNVIQNIQISRAAEAKISSNPRSEKDNISFNNKIEGEDY